MNTLDDLRLVWRQTDARPPDPALDALKDEAARLDRTLRRRDLREVGAAALVALGFGAIGVLAPGVRASAFALVGVGVWIAGVIAGVRLSVPRAAPWDPLRDALAAEHRWLSVQVRLLRWAGLWYVAPVALGVLAFDYALGGFRPVFPLLVVGLAVFLVWANWTAADEVATTRDAFASRLHALDSDA